jgi:two-component system sensor histidine kinase BaeS
MRYALLSADGSLLAGPNRPRESLQLPIMVDGERVGQLLQYPKPQLEDDLAQAFSRAQWTNGMFSALGIVLVLLPASWWYARRLATPLSRMADRARQISAGDYAGRVALHSKDEIGELAADFDAMAAALEQNRQARQRWTAEISHELRTPLAVMRAEIEAIEDGLRPLDSRALQSLGNEVQRLGGLVDDLYQLARADAGSLDYRMQRCDLVALIHQAIASHAAGLARAGLHLTTQLPERAELWADPDRLLQLIGNLLTNSLRYTDTGGRLHVSLSPTDQGWDWRFEDSAPAVAAEALPQLFEPLFRADPSRSRQHGGAGLGLAIVQRIALAHGASVSAELSALGGLCIRLRWPLR